MLLLRLFGLLLLNTSLRQLEFLDEFVTFHDHCSVEELAVRSRRTCMVVTVLAIRITLYMLTMMPLSLRILSSSCIEATT